MTNSWTQTQKFKLNEKVEEYMVQMKKKKKEKRYKYRKNSNEIKASYPKEFKAMIDQCLPRWVVQNNSLR